MNGKVELLWSQRTAELFQSKSDSSAVVLLFLIEYHKVISDLNQ
jgi:hypothetical protein